MTVTPINSLQEFQTIVRPEDMSLPLDATDRLSGRSIPEKSS